MVSRLRGSVAILSDVAVEDMVRWPSHHVGRESDAACRKTIHLGKEIEMEWTNELALLLRRDETYTFEVPESRR
jgi:hypothetical protein